MLSVFPRDVLDEIWDLIESVSEGFPTYTFDKRNAWWLNFARRFETGCWDDDFITGIIDDSVRARRPISKSLSILNKPGDLLF